MRSTGNLRCRFRYFYINRQFSAYFTNESKLDVENISTADIKELYLITPKYLFPFLQYVKDHRKLFKIVMEKSAVLGSDKQLRDIFKTVFSPIMDRYKVPEQKKPFLMSFTIDGIIGIVKVWLKNDCQEPIEFVLDIIIECINKPINKF